MLGPANAQQSLRACHALLRLSARARLLKRIEPHASSQFLNELPLRSSRGQRTGLLGLNALKLSMSYVRSRGGSIVCSFYLLKRTKALCSEELLRCEKKAFDEREQKSAAPNTSLCVVLRFLARPPGG
jgi:hypothetical protein